MHCTLCNAQTVLFSTSNQRSYYKCEQCDSIALDASFRLSNPKEKERYLLHQNDVTDKRYQNFVSPIVNTVHAEQNLQSIGLDFGSGSGPVISSMLREKGYTVVTYDPFFDDNPSALKREYEYIVCCEVMEHFFDPHKEFTLLSSILKPNGSLYCKTKLLDKPEEFDHWWYKNDPTHVFFYTRKTLAWICEHYNFKAFFADDDIIIFRK